MIVIIQEKIWSNDEWLVVASVDAGTGTMVGPFIIALPEDATDEQLTAEIEKLIGG